MTDHHTTPAGAAMHVHSSVRSGRDELDRWSDGHHAESLTRPGWISLRRFARLADREGPLAVRHDFDILTAIDLAEVGDAARILDRSYTPSQMPTTIEGMVAKRVVLETIGHDAASEGAAFGPFMVQLTTTSGVDDHLPATAVDAPVSGVRRWRAAESDITTFDRPTGEQWTVEQFEVDDLDALDRVVEALTALPAPPRSTRRISAYRQVFPAQGAFFGETTRAGQ